MPFIVKLNYLRIAPRKVRLITDAIRGKSAGEAQNILNFTIKKTSGPVLKLLKSAIANAKKNSQMDESNLYISKILVDEGPKYKRWMPRARGSANEIQKKSSHITLVLSEIAKGGKKNKTEKKQEVIRENEVNVQKEVGSEKAKEEKKSSQEQPKFKPRMEESRPKVEKGINKIFRRKAM